MRASARLPRGHGTVAGLARGLHDAVAAYGGAVRVHGPVCAGRTASVTRAKAHDGPPHAPGLTCSPGHERLLGAGVTVVAAYFGTSPFRARALGRVARFALVDLSVATTGRAVWIGIGGAPRRTAAVRYRRTRCEGGRRTTRRAGSRRPRQNYGGTGPRRTDLDTPTRTSRQSAVAGFPGFDESITTGGRAVGIRKGRGTLGTAAVSRKELDHRRRHTPNTTPRAREAVRGAGFAVIAPRRTAAGPSRQDAGVAGFTCFQKAVAADDGAVRIVAGRRRGGATEVAGRGGRDELACAAGGAGVG